MHSSTCPATCPERRDVRHTAQVHTLDSLATPHACELPLQLRLRCWCCAKNQFLPSSQVSMVRSGGICKGICITVSKVYLLLQPGIMGRKPVGRCSAHLLLTGTALPVLPVGAGTGTALGLGVGATGTCKDVDVPHSVACQPASTRPCIRRACMRTGKASPHNLWLVSLASRTMLTGCAGTSAGGAQQTWGLWGLQGRKQRHAPPTTGCVLQAIVQCWQGRCRVPVCACWPWLTSLALLTAMAPSSLPSRICEHSVQGG